MKSSVAGWTPDLTVPEQRDVISHTSIIIRIIFLFFIFSSCESSKSINFGGERVEKEGRKERERVMKSLLWSLGDKVLVSDGVGLKISWH